MPDPCVQYQEHAWKKNVCVNCLRPRAHHGQADGPVASKRHSKSNMDAQAGRPPGTKPEIKSAKPERGGARTNGTDKNAHKVESVKGGGDRTNNVTDDDVKNSLAKLMAKQSPTPKHERLQRNGANAGSSVYSRGFPDLAKLKSNPGSPIKTPGPGGTTPRSPSMDSSTSTTSTMSGTSNIYSNERRSSADLLKTNDYASTDRVSSKMEQAREKRAETLNAAKTKGSRPHAPPPMGPPPCPPGGAVKDKKPTGDRKSSGGHYYHQYDLTMAGRSGTPASTLEKAKKIKAKKTAQEEELEDVHVAMPYTVVDLSQCVPKDDKAPKLPNCPAPDKMDSLRSNASAKRYNGKLDKNLSHLHNTKPKEATKKIEEVLPAAGEFDFIDDGEKERDTKSPSPPRKGPIMTMPSRPVNNTYEPIDGDDFINGEASGGEPSSKSSTGRSVTFGEGPAASTAGAAESSPAPKRQDKNKKSGGKSFFKKLLGFGSKENNLDQPSNSLDNSVEEDLASSQDNLDSNTCTNGGAKAKKKPPGEKSVSFGFTSAWTEAISRNTPERETPSSSPATPSPESPVCQSPPLSPKLNLNLSPGAQRQPALSKELEIDTSFIDKVMKDTAGAPGLSPGGARGASVSPRGQTSPVGPVSPSGRVAKSVKHPGVPPPPAPSKPQPKLNSEHPLSSQAKSSHKRVSINVNDLKSVDRKSALLEAAEKPPAKTVNLETDHSKAILGDALEEPVYEIGNLKDELSSLLEGFGKSFEAEEKMDALSSPEQTRRDERPAVDMAGSTLITGTNSIMTESMMSTSSVSSGSDTLTRRRSRGKADGLRTSVRRMSAAPPPPPPDPGRRASRTSDGSNSQPTSPSREDALPSSPFTRKGLEISGPIPGSAVFTHCTLPRKHKPVRALSSPDDRKMSVDDWVCTRNRRMNAADKHARNKTVTEGVDLQAIQDWNSNNLGSRAQSDDRFGDLFGGRFLNRALPPTPHVPAPDIAEELHGETDSVTENVYELVHTDRASGSSDRGAYEDIDERDIYSDPVDACPVPKVEEDEDSLLLSRCISNDYLEPVNHEGALDKNLKPAIKNKPKTVNFDHKDLGVTNLNKPSTNLNGIYSTNKPNAQPRSCVKKADVRLSGEHYVDVYANTDVLLDQGRLATTYKEGFNKMAALNIETLQKLADSIYFRFIPKDPHYLSELKWRDFALRNTDIELIQGIYGYYRVRCARIRPHDCYIIVCAKSLKLGLLDFCHANVLSPFAIFTDHISADYFPESVTLPHAYQLYGLEQTNIACLSYTGMVAFRDYWDAKHTEMSSFTPIAYERLIANHLAQILNGLLHVRDQGCIVRRLETEYLMVVTSGSGEEEHPVINPAQWDFDDMLDIDPEPLCLDVVAVLLTMFRLDPSSIPLTGLLQAIPAKTKYSQGFHRLLPLLSSHSWESLIQARDMMEFLLWGPEEEDWKSLLAADDPQQAFNVWLEVARSNLVTQFAVQRPPPTIEVANKLRCFCALTGSAWRDVAKLLRT